MSQDTLQGARRGQGAGGGYVAGVNHSIFRSPPCSLPCTTRSGGPPFSLRCLAHRFRLRCKSCQDGAHARRGHTSPTPLQHARGRAVQPKFPLRCFAHLFRLRCNDGQDNCIFRSVPPRLSDTRLGEPLSHFFWHSLGSSSTFAHAVCLTPIVCALHAIASRFGVSNTRSQAFCSALSRPVYHFVREAPRSGPLFDDLTRAKSAKELKEHLETRVL